MLRKIKGNKEKIDSFTFNLKNTITQHNFRGEDKLAEANTSFLTYLTAYHNLIHDVK